MADVHSKETRSFNMSRIRSSGTKIELLLAKALWNEGIRYRKNDKTVYGKPDFAFKGIKLAIFCDSEFWHGKDFAVLQNRIGTNKEFWITKITKNIERDIKVNGVLSEAGWTILRYWEKDIKKDIVPVVAEITTTIKQLKELKNNRRFDQAATTCSINESRNS
ncbi:very short patch repair endonuclease [Mucilaginibacter ximonensis]|uniref:Very short patch repair endonuclease n=1 Tax=Mucilaginibacter ximonensis TaxID=538021 RepID=A0ABW5YCY7_9SPHI